MLYGPIPAHLSEPSLIRTTPLTASSSLAPYTERPRYRTPTDPAAALVAAYRFPGDVPKPVPFGPPKADYRLGTVTVTHRINAAVLVRAAVAEM